MYRYGSLTPEFLAAVVSLTPKKRSLYGVATSLLELHIKLKRLAGMKDQDSTKRKQELGLEL